MEDDAYGRVALNMNDSQNDQNIQLKQVDEMISMGVRVLLINLVDSKAAQVVINKAKAAKSPIIFFNKVPEALVLNSYNKAWHDCHIPVHPDAIARTKHALDEIKKACIPVQELAEDTAMWDTSKAKNEMDGYQNSVIG